VFINRYPYV